MHVTPLLFMSETLAKQNCLEGGKPNLIAMVARQPPWGGWLNKVKTHLQEAFNPYVGRLPYPTLSWANDFCGLFCGKNRWRWTKKRLNITYFCWFQYRSKLFSIQSINLSATYHDKTLVLRSQAYTCTCRTYNQHIVIEMQLLSNNLICNDCVYLWWYLMLSNVIYENKWYYPSGWGHRKPAL